MGNDEIERTIEFLLEHQAKFETDLERWRTEAQGRLDRHDRQILLLGRLGRQLTRRIFDSIDALAQQQRATGDVLDALAQQQRTTEDSLALFARTTQDQAQELRAQLLRTDEHLRETDEHLRETDEHLRETDAHLRETDARFRRWLDRQDGANGAHS